MVKSVHIYIFFVKLPINLADIVSQFI